MLAQHSFEDGSLLSLACIVANFQEKKNPGLHFTVEFEVLSPVYRNVPVS